MSRALCVDCSDWTHIQIEGADAVSFVQRVTTANVSKLAVGDQTWGAILTAKGRLLTVFMASRSEAGVALHVSPDNAQTTFDLLDRYLVMDDVALSSIVTPCYRVWTKPADVWTAPIVFGPPNDVASPTDVEAMRIWGGLPTYGIDISDANFPFETPLSEYLDYEKGCYIGQEPVFRVHTMGGAAKTLRLLVAEKGVLQRGLVLGTPEKADVGKVTSVTEDGKWALAMVHRSAWHPGSGLAAADVAAIVAAVPLAATP